MKPPLGNRSSPEHVNLPAALRRRARGYHLYRRTIWQRWAESGHGRNHRLCVIAAI